MAFKQWIMDYVYAGVDNGRREDVKQQIGIARLSSSFGFLITFLLGLSALIRNDTILGSILLAASVLFFASHLILKYSHLEGAYHFATSLVGVSVCMLVLALIFTGGYHNTGPLWIYIVPPALLFFWGLAKGLRNLGVFALIVSLLLFYPDDQLLLARYSDEFKSRLLYSFLCVSALFAFYEYGRQRSYDYLQSLVKKFEQQARRDPLSGLQNRRGMLEKLADEHKRTKRSKQTHSLIMCDIDRFKKVNDDFGHETGDYIIKELATLFLAQIRTQDTVARWGGEEFLFLLPHTTEHQAYILAEKIRHGVGSIAFKYQQKTVNISVSIGVYQVAQTDTINHAISQANFYLYQAKDRGRNCTAMSSGAIE